MRVKNLRRALTIEYAIVLMVLVAAFTGLIFAVASLTTENAEEYETYVQKKAVLDELGSEFIQSGDATIDEDNEYNLSISIVDNCMIVYRGSQITASSVDLHVERDSDSGEAVLYVYGCGDSCCRG